MSTCEYRYARRLLFSVVSSRKRNSKRTSRSYTNVRLNDTNETNDCKSICIVITK